MIKCLSLFEEKIEYSFNNKAYLEEALTHSSYANEKRINKNNERMEFLGDAVLSIISAEFLYNRFPELPEGDLTRIRSSLVCTESLSKFAKQIDMGSFIYLGKGERLNNGKERLSTLEDAFEALIAAIYLDGGMKCAKRFVLRFLEEELKHHDMNKKADFIDYKTRLQIIIQENPEETLTYSITDEIGPDHDKSFVAEVRINSNVIGRGEGKSKKQAEQEAAREALQLMGL